MFLVLHRPDHREGLVKWALKGHRDQQERKVDSTLRDKIDYEFQANRANRESKDRREIKVRIE
jgi:hypothetical protein